MANRRGRGQQQQHLQLQIPLLLQIIIMGPVCLGVGFVLKEVVDFILQVSLSFEMFEDVFNGIYYQFLHYYTYCSRTKVRNVVQNLGNQVHVKFCDVVRTLIDNSSLLLDYLMTCIYNITLRFLEIIWQVLNKLLNYATYIGGWFHGNILQLVTLLDAHFPGGIPVIAILIFVIIIVIKLALALQHVHRLSEAYNRCMEDQQKLQLKLENIELMLQRETEKLKHESDKNLKLRLNLEDERDKRLCGICQDRIKKIVLLPCQHLCLCKQCLDHKKWKNCPICRQGVESTMMIYV